MVKLQRRKTIEIIVHVIVWIYIFLSPLLFKHSQESIDWHSYLNHMIVPICTCVAFYINYFFLIPRYLLKEKRKIRTFILWNVILTVLLAILMEVYIHMQVFSALPDPEHQRQVHDMFRGMGVGEGMDRPHGPRGDEMMRMAHNGRPMGPHGENPGIKFPLFVFFKNIITMASVCAVAVCIRLSLQWQKSEMARQKAETARTDAELKVLQHQVSPHFLLNSLNNIYALISFDTEKAQESVMELSRILRYQLYESTASFVSLSKEVEFLQNYIDLMHIRLSSNTTVTTDFKVKEDDNQLIAPNILISIVENAFKHGVSPTEPSFIKVNLEVSEGCIRFSCENSNYPKKPSVDKSGGGLGLQQVAQMLEISYKDHYEWKRGVSEDGKTYSSNIIIRLS